MLPYFESFWQGFSLYFAEFAHSAIGPYVIGFTLGIVVRMLFDFVRVRYAN
jgi:hypothetical protein